MESESVSFNVLYMQDEHRSSKIDASRGIVYVFKFNNNNFIIVYFLY